MPAEPLFLLTHDRPPGSNRSNDPHWQAAGQHL